MTLTGRPQIFHIFYLETKLETAKTQCVQMLRQLCTYSEEHPPNDVIVPVKDNLDIVPANTEVTGLMSIHKIKTFKDFIKQMRKIYDYILIDVPPSPNWSHVLCLSVCDYVMPIVNPDAASPKAIIGLNDSVEEIQSTSNPSLEYLGIIMNKYNERTNIAKTMLQQTENIAKQLEVSLFDTKIHQSVLLEEHILSHQSIFEYAGKSKAAKEYKNLSEEEFRWFIRILKKSKKMGTPISQRKKR